MSNTHHQRRPGVTDDLIKRSRVVRKVEEIAKKVDPLRALYVLEARRVWEPMGFTWNAAGRLVAPPSGSPFSV